MKLKIFLLLLFLIVGNNFLGGAFANNFYTSQAVQEAEESPEKRFWSWYQKLDGRERRDANTFLRNFLLKENNLSENLNSFSSNKSQALALSGFIEEAEQSPTLREVLICTAYEGGSGCAP